jgi:D-inositol-3-phosphate glycosyltransferase
VTLATFEPYVHCGLEYNSAGRNGSTAFHNELIEAALSAGGVEQVHIFSDPRFTTVQAASVNELNVRLGRSGLLVYSLRSFASRCSRSQYVFLCRAGQMANACHLRTTQSRYRSAFPICAFLHAAAWPRLISDCLSLLILCRPHDIVVASSVAGAHAFRSALEAASTLLATEGICLPPDRVRVIVRGFGAHSQQLTSIDRRSARLLLNLPLEPVIALYFGRISESYKADLKPLVVALRKATAATPERACLVIAGTCSDPHSIQNIERWVAAVGLTAQVRVLANVAAHTKSLLFAAADLFVSPVDNVQETFGLALLEAMSVGLPIIASDWSGYRDIVMDGKTGFLIPTYWSAHEAADAGWKSYYTDGPAAECDLAARTVVDIDILAQRLALLINNPQRRTDLGRAALARFQATYSWSSVLPDLTALWADLRDRCSRCCTAPPQGEIDYQKVYSHYASAAIEDSWMVETADLGLPWEDNPAITSALQRGRSIEQTVSDFGSGSISIGELAARHGRRQVETFLKQGLLRHSAQCRR